jgi:N-hydroxyarylamine O-acetyltransferase
MSAKNSTDPDKYLARIGAAKPAEPDLAALNLLMERHLLTVPFENLDILAGRDIVLRLSHLYDKVVERNRGGYCYELNSLFRRLLAQLGYRTILAAARVYNPKRKAFGPEFDHMVILVRLDRVYLVDVGFGQSVRRPLALPDGEIDDPMGRFRLRPGSNEKERYVLERRAPSDWLPRYDFSTKPREMPEFQEMNVHHQTSPHSNFTKAVLCSIATPKGWLTLDRDTLITTDGGRTERVELPSSDTRDRIVAAHFGISRL